MICSNNISILSIKRLIDLTKIDQTVFIGTFILFGVNYARGSN